MPGQQTSIRKKLFPRKPKYVSIKECKTKVVYNPRDYGLTKRQQSWAYSLSASLSGYSSRQKFFKDHLEARVQVAANIEASARPEKAEWQVQQSRAQSGEGKAEVQALSRQSFAQKAASWARKARLMHEAGSGNKETKAWDTEQQVYSRDYVLEAEIAAYKAAKNADFSDSDRSTDSSDSDGAEDGEDSRESDTSDSEVEIADTPSGTRPQMTSVVRPSPAPIADWRVKARNGIVKKKLSITKRWSAVTWNQKSNVQERLLLLEDDGLDIQGLQDRKVTSEEVTKIILERVATTRGPSVPAGSPARVARITTPRVEVAQDQLPEWLDPSLPRTNPLPEQTANSVRQSTASPKSHSEPHPKPQPTPPLLAVTSYETKTLQQDPVVTDTTQPFSHSKPYIPQPSARLKRKHSTNDLDDVLIPSSPPRKKRNIVFKPENELVQCALQEVKAKVLRRIFRSARSLLQKPAAVSKVIFSPSPAGTESTNHTTLSPLDYLYNRRPKAPIHDAQEGSPSISPQGLKQVMHELRFLASAPESDAEICIHDPDLDSPPLYTPAASPESRSKANLLAQQRQESRIVVSGTDDGSVVFQGETCALAELFGALREGKLLYLEAWTWDGLRVRRGEGPEWGFGPETQGVLGCVEGRLRMFGGQGSGEVRVCVV